MTRIDRRGLAGRNVARRALRPGVEGLEGRRVPATLTVMTTAASGPGSLLAAFQQANADPAPDTIVIDPSLHGTISPTGGLPEVSTPITIQGPGASTLAIASRLLVGSDGNLIASGLNVQGITNLGWLTLSDSTVAGAVASGVYNAGTMNVTGCTIRDNVDGDLGSGGPISRPGRDGTGGGVHNVGVLTITDSTISGNSLIAGGSQRSPQGGGVYNEPGGRISISDSTISGNTTSDIPGSTAVVGVGGAILNQGVMTVSASTISDNAAGHSPGIASTGSLTITSSILANAGGNLDATAFTSGGYNLFSDAPSGAHDPSDLLNTDPLLGPLADNGGATFTHALLPGSPAIHAAGVGSIDSADQRGVDRAIGTPLDIGAFQSRGFTLAIVGGSGQSATVGSAFGLPLAVSVSSPYGDPVAGGRLTFAAPTSGASADLGGGVVTIGADGVARRAASALGAVGPYNVTAGALGASGTVSFAMTNTAASPPVITPSSPGGTTPSDPTAPSAADQGTTANPGVPEASAASGTDATVGPTITGWSWQGGRGRWAVLVVTLSGPLDPTTAGDVAHYRLVGAGRDGRLGTRDDRPIAIRSATYDASSRTITLRPARPIPGRGTFLLTVDGASSGGLRGTNGAALGGNGDGQLGGDYQVVIRAPGTASPARLATAGHRVGKRNGHR